MRLLSRFGLRALIERNPGYKKRPRCGRRKYFDEALYKTRYVNERSFACLDSLRTLLIRFGTTAES